MVSFYQHDHNISQKTSTNTVLITSFTYICKVKRLKHHYNYSPMKDLFAFLSLFVFSIATTQATQLTVGTTATTGPTSLPGIVAAASSGDTIVFNAAINNSTITVTSTISIDKNLTIIGPGTGLMTLTNNTNAVFNITAGNTVHISGLTFDGSLAIENEGICFANNLVVSNSPATGITNINTGSLYLSNSEVTNNASSLNGGGISSSSSYKVVVDNVLFSGNSVTGSGGAIASSDSLLISNCTFYNNKALFSSFGEDGGAIFYDGPYLELTSSVLDTNFASGEGGALNTANANKVYIDGCRFIDNEARNNGGAVNASGTIGFSAELNITNTHFEENYAIDGGALSVNNIDVANVNRSSFIYNEADERGGAIFLLEGRIDIKNSTLSGNEANTQSSSILAGGGAIFLRSSTPSLAAIVAIENSTITDNGTTNIGGGVFSSSLGLVLLSNTIIAGNRALNSDADVSAIPGSSSFNTLGYNLIGDSTGMGTSTTTDQYGNTANPIDPMLLPFDDFGGLTPTHALQCGSPAIDAGNDTITVNDQRELPRYNAPDIGAFELQLIENGIKPDLGPDIIMEHIDTSFNAGTSADLVNWYNGDGVLQLANNNNFQLTTNSGITVIAEVINRFKCAKRDTVIVDMRVGINELDLEKSLNIYPNPTTGAVTISGMEDLKGVVTVTNMLGQLVDEVQFNKTNTINIDLSTGSGVYFVTLQTKQGRLVRKLLVE